MGSLKLVIVITLGLCLGFLLWFKHSTLPAYEHWYQMTWKGQDVGYMQTQAFVEDKHYEIRTDTRVKTTNQGVDFSFNERQVLRFSLAKPQELISSYYRFESPHHFSESRLQQTEQGYQGLQSINNKQSLSLINQKFNLSDYLALQNWLKEEPQVGSTQSILTLLPDKLEFININYQIDSVAANMRTVSSISPDTSNAKTMLANSSGYIEEYNYNDIISLSKVDKQSDLTVSNTDDYYATQMIPVDKPLGNPMQWHRIRLQVNNAGLLAQISPSRRQMISDNEILLSADISARTQQKNDTPIYHLPDDQPLKQRLQKMALEVTQNSATPIEKLTALREYVSTYIEDVPRIQSAEVAELLDLPEGDCTEHALLFNALVASLGYATRTVDGLVYLGDNFQGFGGHQWSEVLVDGYWVGFDATWNINSLSATHIRLDQTMSEAFFNRTNNTDDYQFTLVSTE